MHVFNQNLSSLDKIDTLLGLFISRYLVPVINTSNSVCEKRSSSLSDILKGVKNLR